MADNFALIKGEFTQGGLDYISEITTFETLEEAKDFFNKNREKYKDTGHMWSGLTCYSVMQIIDNKYVELEGDKALDYGTSFLPNEDVWTRRK